MNHDIVTFNFKDYKAVLSPELNCKGCHVLNTGICHKVNCQSHERKDKTTVIYKPHYRLGVKL